MVAVPVEMYAAADSRADVSAIYFGQYKSALFMRVDTSKTGIGVKVLERD